METVSQLLEARWQALSSHLTTNFYKPDLEALEVALSAAAAHYCIQQDPVWLFVIGPSSSGKTSVIITALEGLDEMTLTMGDLTPKTFSSHFQAQGNKPQGLLHQIGNGGSKILLWKDFTTFLSKRDDDKLAIAAQLREIYDGKIAKHSGVSGPPLWEGLITVVAAATPALERAWSVMRDLGERFVTVRWPWLGEADVARWAERQRGREREIAAKTRQLTKDFVQPSRLKARGHLKPLEGETLDRIIKFAQITSRMRGHVIRDPRGREIIDEPYIEESGRLVKSLGLLCNAHAALWERDPGPDDLRIAKRAALDSIPNARRKLLEHIPDHSKITRAEIAELTKLPPATVSWTVDELEALRVLTVTKQNPGMGEYEFVQVGFTPEFQAIKDAAFHQAACTQQVPQYRGI